MILRRVLAMTRSNVKRTFREPSFLFLVIMFPVALTVLFATAFGGIGGAPASYHIAVVDLDTEGTAPWSTNLVTSLESTGLLIVHRFADAPSARADLAEGRLQALLVIPQGFGAACQSYVASPNNQSEWTPASLQLVLDPGSMVSMQAIPPMVHQVMADLVYGNAALTGPVKMESLQVEGSSHVTVFDQMAPGVITFSAVFLTMIVGQSFALDRERGVLRRIGTTPLTSGEFIASHLLSNMSIALIQLAIVFALILGLGFHSATTPEGLVLAFALVLMFSVCSVGFGLITASIARSPGQATMVAFAFIMPQMFLGTFMGASLSSAAQAVGAALPAYYVTDGLNTILLRGGSLSGSVVVLNLTVVAGFAIAALVIGTVLFRRMGNR